MTQPIKYQRIESAVVFVASLYFYVHLKLPLVLFFVFLFSIDIFMVGYLKSKVVGARLYNIGHSLIIPPLLLVIGVAMDRRMIIAAGLIWLAHIGFDRALGYGLKLPTDFTDTHLGKIGNPKIAK